MVYLIGNHQAIILKFVIILDLLKHYLFIIFIKHLISFHSFFIAKQNLYKDDSKLSIIK